MSINLVQVGTLFAEKTGSVNPAKHPDEEFELYSIPAFDSRKPEITTGAEIGSSKQVVKTGDVLLSKIVPHIRRAWVVGKSGDRRLIASGEWIVFRNEKIWADYFKHVLVGDPFHAMFMNTVAGVGGSLLRARPTYVKRIKVPLPPLAEQKRIAEVLDRAEALRARRRAALALLDELTQSIFLDMFGDPSTSSQHGLPIRPLASFVRSDDRINYGVVQPGDDLDDGVPLVRVGDLQDGRVAHESLKLIAPSIEERYRRSRLAGDEVLLVCVGASAGLVAMADESVKGFNIARAVARIPLANTANPVFIAEYLRTQSVQRRFQSELRTVAQPTLNIKQINELDLVCHPIEQQNEVANRIDLLTNLKSIHQQAIAKLDELFTSLQSAAFRGDVFGRSREPVAVEAG